MQSHFEKRLVVFHRFRDGHLNFVTQKLCLLVRGFDLFQHLLDIGGLDKIKREKKYLRRKPFSREKFSYNKFRDEKLVTLDN